MRKLKYVLACLMLVTSVSVVSAQTKVASGKVVSAKTGEAVVGAKVVVKGTTNGMLTDADGKYKLQVKKSAKTLVISLIGMKTVKVPAKPNQVVEMEQDVSQLDEVVVVAYGTAKKKTFTGSAVKVSGEELSKKSTAEVTKSLTGEVAGVQVMNTSGQPGSNASILIRGVGSVNASAAPLYVVDGMPYYGDISSISPSDIESTTILKDATATALYGSRGANGVILITTRKGVKGSSKIEVEAKVGQNNRWIPLYETISSPERYAELSWEAVRNANALTNPATPIDQINKEAYKDLFDILFAKGKQPNVWLGDVDKLIDPTTGKFVSGFKRRYTPEKWADHIFSAGKRSQVDVKISGGEGNTSYFTSVGLLKDEGYYIGSDFSRINTRLNLDHKVKEWLKGNVNMTYTYLESNTPGQGDNQNNGFQFVNFMPSVYGVFQRDVNGDKELDEKIGGGKYGYDYGTWGRPYAFGINPAGALQLDKENLKSHQLTANSMIEAKFFDKFKATANVGLQYIGSLESSLVNPYYGDAEGIGRVAKSSSNLVGLTANQILSYKDKFADHSLEGFVAHETNAYLYSYTTARKNKIAKPDNWELSNAIIMEAINSDSYGYTLESYFGQLKYNYDERYFAHLTIRSDGSSRFAKENRWGTFGSFGLAWALNNESFMQEIDWVDNLKYKVSYGILGNQSFLTPGAAKFYPTENLYAVGNLQDQIFLSLIYLGNKDLTWERSKTFNTGIEFELFDKKLTGEIEYFHKRTDNLLYSRQLATSTGVATKTYNEGAILNQGIEVTLKATVLDTRRVKMFLRGNISHYANKMLEMPLDITTGKEKPYEVQGAYGWSKDHSLYDYYMREWAGVDENTGEALWNSYYNEKEDGTKELIKDMLLYTTKNEINKLVTEKTNDYTKATKKYVGKSALPKLAGGFGFDLEAYGFELNTTIAYSIGGYGYDYIYASLMNGNVSIGERNYHKDIENRWTETNKKTDVPRIANNYTGDAVQNFKYQSSFSTRFLTSNSYLHLSNIRLGYNFSNKLLEPLKLSKLSLYVTGENLMLLSARKGFVPISSLTGANGRSDYAPVSTVTFGAKLTF